MERLDRLLAKALSPAGSLIIARIGAASDQLEEPGERRPITPRYEISESWHDPSRGTSAIVPPSPELGPVWVRRGPFVRERSGLRLLQLHVP